MKCILKHFQNISPRLFVNFSNHEKNKTVGYPIYLNYVKQVPYKYNFTTVTTEVVEHLSINIQIHIGKLKFIFSSCDVV